jgi:hypothetical protein
VPSAQGGGSPAGETRKDIAETLRNFDATLGRKGNKLPSLRFDWSLDRLDFALMCGACLRQALRRIQTSER